MIYADVEMFSNGSLHPGLSFLQMTQGNLLNDCWRGLVYSIWEADHRNDFEIISSEIEVMQRSEWEAGNSENEFQLRSSLRSSYILCHLVLSEKNPGDFH